MTDGKEAVLELLNGILATCPGDFDTLIGEAIDAVVEGDTTIFDIGETIGQGLYETRGS